MKTNFEHLRKYGKVFNYATKAEEILVTATDNIEIENGFTCIRKSLEGLILELEKVYRINWGENNTLYEKIKYMEQIRLLDTLCVKDLHFIRKGCNGQSHFNEFDQNRQWLMQVYKAFYRQSYRIAMGYLDEKYVQGVRGVQGVHVRAEMPAVQKPAVQMVKPVPVQPVPVQPVPVQQQMRPQPKKNSRATAWKIALAIAGYAVFMMILLTSF